MNIALYIIGFVLYVLSLIFAFSIGIEAVFCSLGTALGAMLFTIAQSKNRL